MQTSLTTLALCPQTREFLLQGREVQDLLLKEVRLLALTMTTQCSIYIQIQCNVST